jgi:hypothetical protein
MLYEVKRNGKNGFCMKIIKNNVISHFLTR